MNAWVRMVGGTVTVLLLSGCGAAGEEAADTGASPRVESTVEPGPVASPRVESSVEVEPHSEASFDPDSIHVLVNKAHPLEPEDFEPTDLTDLDVPQQFGGQQLRAEAAAALEDLVETAADDGIDLWVTTAYRDVEHQQGIYDQRVAEHGQQAAEQLVSRPGYSEHHTGLAVDMSFEGNDDCNLHACFADTPQGQWLAEHAPEFGFIIRYPEGAKDITGYSYEPWHLRYVQEPTAQDVTSQEVTLEEYWGQQPAPDYHDDD